MSEVWGASGGERMNPGDEFYSIFCQDSNGTLILLTDDDEIPERPPTPTKSDKQYYFRYDYNVLRNMDYSIRLYALVSLDGA